MSLKAYFARQRAKKRLKKLGKSAELSSAMKEQDMSSRSDWKQWSKGKKRTQQPERIRPATRKQRELLAALGVELTWTSRLNMVQASEMIEARKARLG